MPNKHAGHVENKHFNLSNHVEVCALNSWLSILYVVKIWLRSVKGLLSYGHWNPKVGGRVYLSRRVFRHYTVHGVWHNKGNVMHGPILYWTQRLMTEKCWRALHVHACTHTHAHNPPHTHTHTTWWNDMTWHDSIIAFMHVHKAVLGHISPPTCQIYFRSYQVAVIPSIWLPLIPQSSSSSYIYTPSIAP